MSDKTELMPIEIDTDATMRVIAEFIKSQVGTRYAFFAMVTPWGDSGGIASYISNAAREEMIVTLREQANSLERGLDITCSSNKH